MLLLERMLCKHLEHLGIAKKNVFATYGNRIIFFVLHGKLAFENIRNLPFKITCVCKALLDEKATIPFVLVCDKGVSKAEMLPER